MNPTIAPMPERTEYDSPLDEEISYRILNRAALMALIVGLLSLLGFILSTLIALGVVGIALAVTGMLQIRKYPLEYSGTGLAKAGLILSLFSIAGGIGYHSYVYATEVPDGFERTSFYELQPTEEHPELPFSLTALELDGKPIFVKGYVYPEDNFGEVQTFVLVPDLGTCCFGGQPKLTDMIEVTLEEPLRVNYSRRQRKLAGVLEVDQRLKPVDGLQGVYFRLKASYVK
jgi:hypothetical protein